MNKRMLIISVLIALSVIIFALLAYNTKSGNSIAVDGKQYFLSTKLSRYMDDFEIDYKASHLSEDYILTAEKEDDIQLYLKSKKYPTGFSVIVTNNTNRALNLQDCIVQSIIIDTTDLSDLPVLNTDKSFKWGMSIKTAEKFFGKVEFNETSDEFTIVRFRKFPHMNFYFTEKKGLYRIMFF